MGVMDWGQEQWEREIEKEEKTVLVDYWAPWCGYCRRIAPALDKVAEQYKDTVIFAKVNVDGEPGLAQREGIEVLPTLVFYRGGERCGTVTAPDSGEQIRKFLQEQLVKESGGRP